MAVWLWHYVTEHLRSLHKSPWVNYCIKSLICLKWMYAKFGKSNKLKRSSDAWCIKIHWTRLKNLIWKLAVEAHRSRSQPALCLLTLLKAPEFYLFSRVLRPSSMLFIPLASLECSSFAGLPARKTWHLTGTRGMNMDLPPPSHLLILLSQWDVLNLICSDNVALSYWERNQGKESLPCDHPKQTVLMKHSEIHCWPFSWTVLSCSLLWSCSM